MADQLIAYDTSSASSPGARSNSVDVPFILAIVGCIAALGCAINTQSIWIDEGYSVWVAAHRNLAAVIRTLVVGDASDQQMPLHYVWLWTWTHLFGFSEYALRTANFPFAAIFVPALAFAARAAFNRRFAWIPLALSPFAWSYINEARAYFILLSMATMFTGALLVWTFGPEKSRKRSAWFMCGGLLASFSAHMLTGLLTPAILLLLVVAYKRRGSRIWHELRTPALVFAAPLLALGVFYATTFLRPATWQYGSASMAHFGAAVYEHLGFGGLGPPRNILRHVTLETFLPYSGWVAFGLLGLGLAFSGIVRRHERTRLALLMIAWLLSFALTIAAAYTVHSRFLGRHITALLPLMLFTTLELLPSWRECMALALVWGISDLRLSLLPDYYKDDYRGAANDVISRISTKPGVVAWAADPLAGNYYGLALEDPGHNAGYEIDYNAAMQKVDWPVLARGFVVEQWDAARIESLLQRQKQAGQAVYLALSKPDIYDADGSWRKFLKGRNAQPAAVFRTFRIYVIE